MLYTNNYNNILSDFIFLDTILTRNLFLNGIYSFIKNNSNQFLPPIYSHNQSPILKKDVFLITKIKETSNDSTPSESSNLFTSAENNSVLFKEETNLINRKRYRERRARKDNRDNIRKK